MSNKIRVIFFQGEDAWVAQGLERDICVQADTLDDLYGRFEVAVRLEKDKSGKLDHIGKAPKHFFKLWDRRSGSYTPTTEYDATLEFGVAA